MMFPAFIDPNLVRLYGYSSRSQKDKDAYVNLLDMRMKAKKGLLGQDFLDSVGLTNEDLKSGLKLPLNSFTGTLRATFNKNADFKQGFGICTTGQLLILQLVYDLQKIPTLEMVSTNTDAAKFYVDDSYEAEVEKTIHDWEKLTGLEMEKEVVVKSFMRDVNSYCEIVEVGKNDYEVHYRGGEFKGKHKFKWDKENKVFDYSFEDEIEANSMTIVSEALLKKLLFDIPIEETINNCDDIFRFQIINHTGSTYSKCVQETENGDVELQKNNRIYASNIPNGPIVKIKHNGQRDTLALCPPNPLVDNGNKCTIDDIDKSWYIKLATQWANDFLGIKRLTAYKKSELLLLAEEKGIIVDKKIKKEDLIEMIEKKDEEMKMATKKVETSESVEFTKTKNIYERLNDIKEEISTIDFVLDKVLPSNMGNGEYVSIAQYYQALNKSCIKHRVYFAWDVLESKEPRELFKPTGKLPNYTWDVSCSATFRNIDDPEEQIVIYTEASGSDISDKGISSASTLAFRNFFDKNFTPKCLTDNEDIIPNDEVKTEAPKVPTFIPQEKKEEIKKEVVATVQHEESDKDDIKEIIDKIMKVRELLQNDEWGAKTLETLMTGEVSSADILQISLKVDNKLDSLEVK